MSADLSVAIIFKNEIRCLERCLKSLQPLRERLSLEIVMADTGSDDGSRAVAERYADILFDFPWINDFAAARNAVLARCTGEWVLVMDCDEWLDEDMGRFADYVCDKTVKDVSAVLEIRNYSFADLAEYSSFYARRLLRLSAHPHYVGAIHEQPEFQDAEARGKAAEVLEKPILHHDGYVMLNDGSEAGKAKRIRNVTLLREKLANNPEDLRTLKEMVEICDEEPDAEQIILCAVSCVEQKKGEWDKHGPAILRGAVAAGARKNMPEVKEWAALAERMFPESNLTKIDINYQMFYLAIVENDTKEAVRRGEAYLQAYRKNKRNRKIDLSAMWYGSLDAGSAASAQEIRVSLARQYAKLGNYELAYARLRELDHSALSPREVKNALHLAAWLCENSDLELEMLIRGLWDGICVDVPSEQVMIKRLQAFFEEGFSLFDAASGQAETRPAWQLFLPLTGRCPLGDAAELMSTETPEEADAILARIDNAASLPPAAFLHAIKIGAAFPIPDRPLTIEDADTLAARLTADKPFLRDAAIFASSAAESGQDLIWARALALAAVQSNDWEADADPQPLLAAFVRTGSTFLARCYSAHAMEMPEYLPPMYRFALHLANAYAVLFPGTVSPEFTPTVTGGVRGALAELKEAAIAAPDQKQAIDWILDEILRTNQ